MGSLAQGADSLDFVRPQPQGEFKKQRENPGAEKYPALPMSSLLSSYLTSSYSLGPQWLLPVGIPYPSWPSWHAGQSSGHSFKCGFLINRETPVRQEGVQARVLYVIVIYRLLGMNTSTEMAWSKLPFLRKSLTTQGGTPVTALHLLYLLFTRKWHMKDSISWKHIYTEKYLRRLMVTKRNEC